nr:putative B3 domain-containing protein At1g78640 [Ipomoea batatas]
MESVSSNSTTTTLEDLGNFAELIDAASSFSLSLFPPTKNPKKLIKNHHRWDDDLIDAASSLSLSLPTKRKRLPKPKKPENSSIQEKEEEGVIIAKRQKKKRLSASDVNLSSRLLLPKEEIIKYVLPLMDMESRTACENRGGLRVKIWDLDTKSEHQLSLRQWKTGSFLLNSNWNKEFVKRRSLHEGDTISMCWDFENLSECTCAATNWTCWVFVQPLGNASIVKPMGTVWRQFCDHHPSHKSFQTNAATFAIFLIIIAKPFCLQHRDFLLRHSMAHRGKRSNANAAKSSESVQEERKSTPQRSQVEKWIEVDFEAVVAQSYGRTWHPNSCNRPNPQSSVTWPLGNASIVKPMGTGWQFCDHHPSHKSFQTNAATFAIIVIIAKPFRLQHRDFLLRHSMASRGKRSNANDAIGKTISALSPASLSQKKEKAVPREVKWKSGLKWISNQVSPKATEERGILTLVTVRIRNLP